MTNKELEKILCKLPEPDRLKLETFFKKQTEPILYQPEEQLRITLNSIGDGVIATDTNGIIISINTIAAELTGWKEQTAIGKPIGKVFKIINEQTRKATKNPVEDVLRLGKIIGLANHTLLIARDGFETPIADSAAPIYDKTGNITGVIMVFQDHIEQRKAKKQLEASEKRYRELFKNVSVGFAVHEMIFDESGKAEDYRYIQVNPMFEKLTGLKSEDVIGKTVKNLLPETENSWIEQYGQVVKTGKPVTFEDYSKEFGKYYQVRAFRTSSNQFGVAFSDVTQRKQLENQLKQTQFVVDNLADVVIWSDEQGSITYVNDITCKVYGYTKDELHSMHIYDLDSEKTPDTWQKALSNLKQQDYIKFERIHYRQDGTTFPVEVTKNLLHFRGNKLICSVIRDITKQKRLQDVIEKRIISLTSPNESIENITFEELFAIDQIQKTQDNLSSAMGLASIIIRPDGTPITKPSNYPKICYDVINHFKTDFTQYYKKQGEHSKEKFYVCPISGLREFSAPIFAEQKHIASWLFGQVRNESQREPNMRLNAKKMGIKEVLFSKECKKVPEISHEQMKKISNAIEDLTKRLSTNALQNIQQARFISNEKKRTEELRKLSVAINQFSDIVLITDVDGNIEYVNPAFEKITGYTKEEAIGKNPRILQSGKQNDAFYKNIWDTIKTKKSWEGRIINQKKNGELYTESATISPVMDSNMYITNFVAIKRDITNDIARDIKMKHAEKMQAVGQLAGGIAHDFNNIMQVIIGFSELLEVDIGHDEKAMNSLMEVQKAAGHAFDLTKQLLLFSRDENIKTTETNLNEIITNTLKIIKSAVGENIRVVANLDPELYIVQTDHRQVERVILNMAINARDAMPEGGILNIQTTNITFALEDTIVNPSVLKGTYVCLAITDSGIGMTDEIKKHIFEPFFTTKGRSNGTGLGLASTYATVQRYNGWINTYSEVGHGTTFKIYIPASSRQISKLSIEETQNNIIKKNIGQHILVVEDDKAILRLMTTALTNVGFNVVSVGDAEVGEEKFHEHHGHFDLLISDVILPGKSGPELAEIIVRAKPDIPILLCSGYSEDRIQKSLLKQKGFHFLAKPFSIAKFNQKVEEILNI